jgi:GH15 family glucan-1,4-alpha-glucosidase
VLVCSYSLYYASGLAFQSRYIQLEAYQLYRPDFDSPSVFCRLLDQHKGGYFTISPPKDVTFTTKQAYLPSSNILNTRYIHESGVVDLVDFLPRPKNSRIINKTSRSMPYRETIKVQDELKQWLIRRVDCIRGEVDLGNFIPT